MWVTGTIFHFLGATLNMGKSNRLINFHNAFYLTQYTQSTLKWDCNNIKITKQIFCIHFFILFLKSNIYSVVVQLLSLVQLFAAPWTAAVQASLFFTISWSLLNLMFTELWCYPAISSSITSFSSCPQSFPASGSFPMIQLCIRWPKY